MLLSPSLVNQKVFSTDAIKRDPNWCNIKTFKAEQDLVKEKALSQGGFQSPLKDVKLIY